MLLHYHHAARPPCRLSRFLPLMGALVVAACQEPTPVGQPPEQTDVVGDDAALFASVAAGQPLPFLNRDQRRRFDAGKALFIKVFTPETGLGPLFNGRSCATCHVGPAVGGVGPQIETHSTEFIGPNQCEEHDDINGGTVKQDSATPLLQAAGIFTEPLPTQSTQSGRRTTPDVFGFGLLEAVPARTILALADPNDRNHDGISGRASISEEGEVGRFGKKGQVPDLLDFITDAFIYEQGITSPDEPEEQTLAGTPLPPGVDPAPDVEMTEEQIDSVVDFVRFLAPPPSLTLGPRYLPGRLLFSQVGCAGCHTPVLLTGPNRIPALNRQVVRAYTDLLIHDMGRDLADNCNGEAGLAEFRTEPLMGVRFSTAFMHDGRASTIEQAILAHGGEATGARARFIRLGPLGRQALLSFVRGL